MYEEKTTCVNMCERYMKIQSISYQNNENHEDSITVTKKRNNNKEANIYKIFSHICIGHSST